MGNHRKRSNPRKRLIRSRDNVLRWIRHTQLGDYVAESSRLRRSLATLRRSGVFDEAFYRAQAGDSVAPGQDAIGHYLTVGSAEGWSPHPLFDPAYYVSMSSRAAESEGDPFVEFITRGVRRGDDPHPLFVTALHIEQYPQSVQHPLGAWGHFLESTDAPWPHPDVGRLGLTAARGGQAYADVVATALQRHREVPDFTNFERVMDTFDHERAQQFVREMSRAASSLETPPTVSVIIPTKDRAATVRAAIASVQAQSYPHWELVVVDDGGSDRTDRVVAQLAQDDPRIRYIHQTNTGVAGARNRGIRQSSGELIAFLDSDNTWVPHFLETMVGFLSSRGLDAAYCASELCSSDQTSYRGRQIDVGALRERNYIDCITIVMRRSLVPALGEVFDERLRRVVDWDLLIRLTEVTELEYAPFIGTSYDLWDETGDRISHRESVGYRHVVRNKHLVDWAAAPQPQKGLVSLVMSIGGPRDKFVACLLDHVRRLSGSTLDYEIVVVDQGLSRGEALRLRLVEATVPEVTVHRLADPTTHAVGRNIAAASARGDVLLLCDPNVHWAPEDIDRLASEVRERAPVILQPTLVEQDGTVRSSGQFLGPATTGVTAGFGHAEQDVLLQRTPSRDAPDGMAFAIDATSYRQLQGFDALFVRGGGDLDLGLRADALGVPTFAVPISGLLSPPPKNSAWSPEIADRTEFVRRWRDRPTRSVGELSFGASVVGVVAQPTEPPGSPRRWTAVPGRAPGDRRRWAIKTSVPDTAVRDTWGDWHFACALRDALQELGEDAVVDLRQAWDRPTRTLDDINLVIRGTQRFEPVPGQINLLWIISHPDKLTSYELEQYDGVFVASRDYAESIRFRWPRVDARPLLQCTDPRRFYPDYDSEAREDVLFVGNSRKILRTVVADAIEAGLEPAIYGSNWEELIPDRFVKGSYLPNEGLRRHYASAGAVLNDHWEDMRRWGFVSNRLFDIVASGGVAVSDPVAGLEELFGDHVVMYDSPEELADAVATARDRHHGDDETVQKILRDHTFTARAEELIRVVDALGTGDRQLHRAPAETDHQPRTTITTAPASATRRDPPPPVFVGGTGRSGTTIMGQLIGSSDDYALVPIEVRFHADPSGLADLIAGRVELDQFEEAMRRKWYHRKPNASGQRGLHVVASWTQLESALEQLRMAPKAQRTAAIGNLVHDLLDPVASRAGKPSWVEMTPPVAKAAGELTVALPSARFVHMVRDGRDVATSVAQRGWGPNDVFEAVSWWADEMISIAESLTRVAPENVLEIRLESLVGEHREHVWQELCEFLGLDDTRRMREFFDSEVTPEKARQGRWAQHLDEEARRALQELYEKELARLESAGITLPPA